MEDFGREIAYPTVEQICQVNRRMIDEYGGLFIPPNNLLNLSSLEYILDVIQSHIYKEDIYYTTPTLKGMASTIAYQIISRHVFNDGNKRTAIHIAWEFLHSNGIHLTIHSSIIDLSISIASGIANQDELLQWLHDHQE